MFFSSVVFWMCCRNQYLLSCFMQGHAARSQPGMSTNSYAMPILCLAGISGTLSQAQAWKTCLQSDSTCVLPGSFCTFLKTQNPPKPFFRPQNILLLNWKSCQLHQGLDFKEKHPEGLFIYFLNPKPLSYPCNVVFFLFVLIQKKWAVPLSNVHTLYH